VYTVGSPIITAGATAISSGTLINVDVTESGFGLWTKEPGDATTEA
jgi:hypothetical protein